MLDDDWVAQVERHSLGWVTARDGDLLVGFVNVAWDGAIHAFILDTIVAASHRRHGIGDRAGRRGHRRAHGRPAASGCTSTSTTSCASFYFDACGFTPTNAGLIPL